ncbi:hypothetical protein BH18ACT3_BH18ACT3_04820 [soil metagenome]
MVAGVVVGGGVLPTVGEGAPGEVGLGGVVTVAIDVVVVVVVDVVDVVLVVVVAFGSTPTPARLTLKSSPSFWLAVSLTVKLDVSLNDPAEPGENEKLTEHARRVRVWRPGSPATR